MGKSRIPYEKYARFSELMCKIAHCAALTLSLPFTKNEKNEK